MTIGQIIILEKENNKKGDLFGRLIGDLFHSLGYRTPRLNIHKSGREIDLQTFHRIENKIAIAECKAQKTPVGGSDINKFIGSLDAEKKALKRKAENKKTHIVGYFISLSGFTETAIQQESEFENERAILIKPNQVIDELIKGRIIVSLENAITSISTVIGNLKIMDNADLLAYDKGWIWALYFSNNGGQTVTHVAFIHAEGNPLLNSLAEDILKIDNITDNIFTGLLLVNSFFPNTNTQNALEETKQKYFTYLENELGEIQFEGLPTDKEAGSVKVQLENIFVPLHFFNSSKNKDEIYDHKRESLGEILATNTKLAILAKPGGGKSTLIKRLAIAYAFPERRTLINDNIPEKKLFPIFLRCRELGDKVNLSLTEIINSIPQRAEINQCTSDFSIIVSKSLQNGEALLLIDGLDEIAEDKNRIGFTNQLRTFIATYPSISLIITSREAGFRIVAGSLASYCEKYTVSNLDKSEIMELSRKWHKAILDDSEATIREANKLSELIWEDSRIRNLAENPLLLTTLLFVKRWAGYLPTKRNVLYQEMIKLLLVTWNVEGHEILDIEEAEPQLSYVAYWMTKNGQQTISFDQLTNCLIDARKQMPEILGYTKVSPAEFIKRVESRSSLLIMSGHQQLESGLLTPVYEFLHLSFQEYLTARAIVKKFIPLEDANLSTLSIVVNNVQNENWKEVIPIVAVLLERECKDLIEYLTMESKGVAMLTRQELTTEQKLVPTLLGNCLANEVQISPSLLESSIEWFIKNIYSIFDKSLIKTILKSKFGETFKIVADDLLFKEYDDKFIAEFGSVKSDVFLENYVNKSNDDVLLTIKEYIETAEIKKQIVATFALMTFVYSSQRRVEKSNPKLIEQIYNILLEKVQQVDINNIYLKHYKYSVFWSIAWAAQNKLFPSSLKEQYSNLILKTWLTEKDTNLNRVCSWALNRILLPHLKISTDYIDTDISQILIANYEVPKNEFDKEVSIFLSFIINKGVSKKDVKKYFETVEKTDIFFDSGSFKEFKKRILK